MRYLLCLDTQYSVDLGETKTEYLNNLMQMLDNTINLLKSYGVEDEEILEEIKEDTTINMEVE